MGDFPGLADETRDQILAEIEAGHKVAAVRLYRQATGTSLSQAKQFIDELQERLEIEESRAPRSLLGCLGVIVVVVGTLLAMIGTVFLLLFG